MFTPKNSSPTSNPGGSNSLVTPDTPAYFKLTPLEIQNKIQALVFNLTTNPAQQNPMVQYSNGVWDALIDAGITSMFPPEQTGAFDRVSSSPAIGEETAEALFNFSNVIANTIVGNNQLKSSFIGACSVDPQIANESCVRNFATRAWQSFLSRPLTANDSDLVESIVELWRQFPEPQYPNQWVFAAFNFILLSMAGPYSYEKGDATQQAGDFIPLTQAEIVTRLTRIFWQDAPDTYLKNLVLQNQVNAQYDQILDHIFNDWRFARTLESFFNGYLKLGDVRHVNFFDSYSRAVALGHSNLLDDPRLDQYAKQEALAFGREKITRSSNFEDLFLSNESFATEGLAQIYGLPAWDATLLPVNYQPYHAGGAPQQHPTGEDRAGILTLAALHLNNGNWKSHFHVGYQILQLTCRETPSLDSAMIDPAMLVLPPHQQNEVVSSVTRSERLVASPTCQRCHAQFDNFGFSLAAIGPYGDWQSQERIYDESNPNLFLGLANVGNVRQHTNIIDGQTIQTSNAKELAQALLQSERLQDCFAKNFVKWAFGRELTLSEDDRALLRTFLTKLLDRNASVKSAFKEFAKSKLFTNRYVGGME